MVYFQSVYILPSLCFGSVTAFLIFKFNSVLMPSKVFSDNHVHSCSLPNFLKSRPVRAHLISVNATISCAPFNLQISCKLSDCCEYDRRFFRKRIHDIYFYKFDAFRHEWKDIENGWALLHPVNFVTMTFKIAHFSFTTIQTTPTMTYLARKCFMAQKMHLRDTPNHSSAFRCTSTTAVKAPPNHHHRQHAIDMLGN